MLESSLGLFRSSSMWGNYALTPISLVACAALPAFVHRSGRAYPCRRELCCRAAILVWSLGVLDPKKVVEIKHIGQSHPISDLAAITNQDSMI